MIESHEGLPNLYRHGACKGVAVLVEGREAVLQGTALASSEVHERPEPTLGWRLLLSHRLRAPAPSRPTGGRSRASTMATRWRRQSLRSPEGDGDGAPEVGGRSSGHDPPEAERTDHVQHEACYAERLGDHELLGYHEPAQLLGE